ncbi:hypothetical protein BHE74_00001255 [Ensete ventricosum]|nr:hypothetical protein BHE74_00001255 [Ensete ventricosum]
MDLRSECYGTAEAIFRVCASILASDESLGHQHMGTVYHRGRKVLKQVVEREEEVTTSPKELSYPKATRRSEGRWPQRSVIVPQRRIYRLGGTSVESSIPCSHGGRVLVVKGAEEVENAGVNSKYQDRAKGQRPRNFIRSVIADINKDQHSSASSTQESIIGELKQHGGSEFDYSTTAVESSWEPRGVLQPKQKIEDSAKGEEMQRLQQLRRGRRRNK